MHFVYVKLPVDSASARREYAWHDGLETALTQHGLGSLIGWGASLTDRTADQPAREAFHRIDIEVADLGAALLLLRRCLVALAVPLGTQIHHGTGSAACQQVLGAAGWTDQPVVAGPSPRQ
jgi:hypothetical protein